MINPAPGILTPTLKGSAAYWIGLYLCFMIIAQPVLDILSYFLLSMNVDNVITFARGALLGIAVLLGLRYQVFKKQDYIYMALLVLFGLSSFMLKKRDMPHMIQLLELITFAKLFSLPMMFLTILRLLSVDPTALRARVVRAIFISSCVVVLSVAVSLLTGTYNYTYDQPWARVGIAGWFYSGNQQSLVLIALMPVFLLVSFRFENSLPGLIAIVIASYMLLFNGTRVSWLGWSAMSAMLLYLLAFMIKSHGVKSRYTAFALILLMGLVGAVMLRSHLPMSKIEAGRNFHLNKMEKTIEKEPNQKQAAKETEENLTDKGTVAEHSSESSVKDQKILSTRETSPLDQVLWSVLTREEAHSFEKQLSRLESSGMELRVAVEYTKAIQASTANQRVDDRYRQRVFTALTRNYSSLSQRLVGVPHQFFSDYIGDLETDYALVFSSYGLVGGMLYFLIFFTEALSALKALKRFKLSWLYNPHIITSGYISIMLLGAAYFAGRTFKQPAVSIYLALALAYLISVLHSLSAGEVFNGFVANRQKNTTAGTQV